MRLKPSPFLLPILASLFFWACGEEPKSPDTKEHPNKFADEKLRRMTDFADRRAGDSLLPFLDDTSASIRAEAAMLFGSVQDSDAGTRLMELVEDPDAQVSTAAAWAIGQLGDSSHTEHLMELMFNGPVPNRNVYGTALGKAGGKLRIQEAIEFYSSGAGQEDQLLPLMHCIYRAGLRNIDLGNVAETLAFKSLESQNKELQLYAAAYLGRVRKPEKLASQEELFRIWEMVGDAEVKIHLVRAFRRTEGAAAKSILESIVLKESESPMVRANAILAAGRQHDLSDAALRAVKAQDHQVATAAAEYLLNFGTAAPENLLAASAATENWRARAILLRAAYAKAEGAQAERVQQRIDSLIAQSSHAYETGYLLAALSSKAAHYDRLLDQCLVKKKISSTLVAEAMMQNLTEICGKDRKKMEGTLRAFVGTGDAAMVALAGEFIPGAQKLKQVEFAEAGFLVDAQAKLKLPEEIETYNALENAIAQIEGRDAHPKQLEYQNPIDWQLLKGIPKDQKAVVETSKGDITFLLLVEQAPGTVANFVKLVQEGFYNEKSFHRIVPAFVAQGGCPRGDGYGSSPGVIRSEWPDLHYGPGMVGMASAGKDTESCQWFITHCHTPHLDGRYTIFAKVIQGMEVVQALEIGDEISAIRLPGLNLL